MRNKKKLQKRYLRDPLPVRLGGLAATLGRISSSARTSESPTTVTELLDEAKHLIEWTAAEAEPETAAELVNIQRLIVLWQNAWPKAANDLTQRTLLSTQAKIWSDQTLQYSGLI